MGNPTTSLLAGLVDLFGDESRILRTATSVFTAADDNSRDELIEEVLPRSASRVKPETLFEAVKTIMDRVPARLLVKIVKNVTRAILGSFIYTMGNLPLIRDNVLSNEVNAATLGLIWRKGAELATFLIDLIEPAKCYIRADSGDGTAIEDNTRNQFNELDFSKSANRHAVISQLQRLAKSIIFILSESTRAGNNTLEYIGITDETRLASDVDLKSIITIKEPNQSPEAEKEKWFFVNGIAGELFWLRLACEKLQNRYAREVTSIFNRGDGILWDLVECAGERTAQRTGIAASQKRLVQRTKSSETAQGVLKDELDKALGDVKWAYIVMIAHSQGCLLLRLALEELVAGADKTIRDAMRERLCVFTFGNPSLDWKLEKVKNGGSEELHSYVCRTEHFANTNDFVAKLGVLSKDPAEGQSSGYPSPSVFTNYENDGNGHLFGAQYSLVANHYKNDDSETSWLLACSSEKAIHQDSRSESDHDEGDEGDEDDENEPAGT